MSSPALHTFLRVVGKVQHHLHTTVVGLSAVERGEIGKPDELSVTWAPKDVRGSAREARLFVLRATIVFVGEELGEYATRILRYHGAGEGSATPLPVSRVDRIRAVASRHSINPLYLSSACVLMRQWRNRIIHKSSNATLTASEKDALLAGGEEIREAVKSLDVARLLTDFERDRPTLKDTTATLALCVRFARQVEASLPALESTDEVRRWLDAEGLLADVLRLERQSANGGSRDMRARGRQLLISRAPSLAEPYYVLGAT